MELTWQSLEIKKETVIKYQIIILKGEVTDIIKEMTKVRFIDITSNSLSKLWNRCARLCQYSTSRYGKITTPGL